MSQRGTAAGAAAAFRNGGMRLFTRATGVLVLFVYYALTTTHAVLAAEGRKAPDLDGPHYSIAVHTSGIANSREAKAIAEFVEHRVAAINGAGGLLGRRVVARFFDDADDKAKTIANVRESLADPRLIASIGIWSSSRGSYVVDDLGKSGVPFVSEMSVEALFKPYPNFYTLAYSVRDEASVFLALASKKGYQRIAYAGFLDDLFTNAYLAHLMDDPEGPGIVSTFWEKEDTQVEDYDQAIDQFIRSGADVVVLSLGSKLGSRFLSRMAQRGLRLPVFISYGSIERAMASGEGGEAYAGDLYELSSGGVANVNNERIKRLARELGIKVGSGGEGDQSYSARELGYGARYADLVGLIVDAAGGKLADTFGASSSTPPLDEDIKAVRDRISAGLASLREGHRYWEGRAQYWTFNEDRATSERAMLLWRPQGQQAALLHPTQFIRVDGKMKEVPVLYLHLDMVRMFEVDSTERRFDAEFYLTLRSKADLTIKSIDFTNAYRTNSVAKPIRARLVATYDDGDAELGIRRIYHVTGRFLFEPDLAKYPFDEQLLTISFQPADADSIFILQPPDEALRGKTFEVEDWRLVSHYVGTTDRIITSVRGRDLREHVIPYYNFNYTWVMRREVIDYIVRVVVPLSFILVVAYLAAYIPRREFNATIAIQVTALLSAIALYFALNQPNSDEVTLSDKIFVSAYAIVSLMIALSIFEIHEVGDGSQLERGPKLTTIRKAQLFVVPFITCAFIGWLIASAATDRSISDGLVEAIRRVALVLSDYTGR